MDTVPGPDSDSVADADGKVPSGDPKGEPDGGVADADGEGAAEPDARGDDVGGGDAGPGPEGPSTARPVYGDWVVSRFDCSDATVQLTRSVTVDGVTVWQTAERLVTDADRAGLGCENEEDVNVGSGRAGSDDGGQSASVAATEGDDVSDAGSSAGVGVAEPSEANVLAATGSDETALVLSGLSVLGFVGAGVGLLVGSRRKRGGV